MKWEHKTIGFMEGLGWFCYTDRTGLEIQCDDGYRQGTPEETKLYLERSALDREYAASMIKQFTPLYGGRE